MVSKNPARLLIPAPKYNQLIIMRLLHSGSTTSQADLAQRCGLSASTVNWYLKDLLRRGLLTCERRNSRTVHYCVTPEGNRAKADLHQEQLTQWVSLFEEGCRYVEGLIASQVSGALNRTALLGTGVLAEMIFHVLSSLPSEVVAICSEDSAIIGRDWCGREIIHFSQARFMSVDTIVVACPRTSEYVDRELEELIRRGCRIVWLEGSQSHPVQRDLLISRPDGRKHKSKKSRLQDAG